MNENIDLTKILKNCPKGTKLYSTVWGWVEFSKVDTHSDYPIYIKSTTEESWVTGSVKSTNGIHRVTSDGKMTKYYNGECILFPSHKQRDWSKFTAPWYKAERFNPKTLKPFDKVIVSDNLNNPWVCDHFSYVNHAGNCITTDRYRHCIPYNDDTKHLVGTTEEAPEYYRYWED